MAKFVIDEIEEVTKTVTVLKPGNQKSTRRLDFSATFTVLSKDDWSDLIDSLDEEEEIDKDTEIARAVITDVKGVFNSKGEELDYSDDLLKQIMNNLHARYAVISEIYALHTKQGRNEARRKN